MAEVRAIFVPVLPSEVLSALLCALVAGVYVRTGVAAMALMVFVLIGFQYLLRELLLSRERAERLAALQLGVLVSMIETLALRDRMTARHSAAVARYARAMARRWANRPSTRNSSTPPGCCTTSASSRSPTRSCWPPRGSPMTSGRRSSAIPRTARGIVRRIDGYGPVADVVLAHHERWDGTGYPRALAGKAIPRASRIIAVADAYDVMTARDSYRKPRPSDSRSWSCAASPAASSTPRSSRSSSSC